MKSSGYRSIPQLGKTTNLSLRDEAAKRHSNFSPYSVRNGGLPYESPHQGNSHQQEIRHHEARQFGRPRMAKLFRYFSVGWNQSERPGHRVRRPHTRPAGLQNAQDLLNDADRVAAANDGIFGTTGGPVSVIVFALGGATDGTGGADHMGCDYTTGAAIEVDASFGNSARVSALFEAELSECSMNGNLCGFSTGEALSRWCAAAISNNALSDFATAPQWAQDGEPDFVDQTDSTDQNADSTGCGMAFLSWLMSQGYSLDKIAPAMVSLGDAGTLAQLYANLTSDTAENAWPNFQNAIQALPNGVTNDDPFGAVQPAQLSWCIPPAVRRVR